MASVSTRPLSDSTKFEQQTTQNNIKGSMREGERGGESSRVAHSEVSGVAGGSNKGERVGGFVSGDQEGGFKGKVSFRDKVVGSSGSKSFEAAASLEGDSLCSVLGKQGDPTPPCVTFTEETRRIFSQPYLDAVVIKVLEKHVSYTALSHKLKGVCKLKGGFDLMDVGNGYFLVKLDRTDDREKVLLGGPWMLNGNYIAVKPWNPTFRSGESSFGSTMVWIKIEGLPIWYYHEKLMTRIASAIGTPIKVDMATKSGERGKFARACVQIDLGLPVTRHVKVDGVVYDVIYESLHLICGSCDCYGHVAQECKKNKVDNISASLAGKGDHAPTLVATIPSSNSDGKVFQFGANQGKNSEFAETDATDISLLGKESDSVFNAKVSSEAKEGEWTTVQRKGKGKLAQPGNGPKSMAKLSEKSVGGKSGPGRPIRKPGRPIQEPSSSNLKKGKLGGKQSGMSKPNSTPFPASARKRPRPASLPASPEAHNGNTAAIAVEVSARMQGDSTPLPKAKQEEVIVGLPSKHHPEIASTVTLATDGSAVDIVAETGVDAPVLVQVLDQVTAISS